MLQIWQILSFLEQSVTTLAIKFTVPLCDLDRVGPQFRGTKGEDTCNREVGQKNMIQISLGMFTPCDFFPK